MPATHAQAGNMQLEMTTGSAKNVPKESTTTTTQKPLVFYVREVNSVHAISISALLGLADGVARAHVLMVRFMLSGITTIIVQVLRVLVVFQEHVAAQTREDQV
jgi:hypothetical protein